MSRPLPLNLRRVDHDRHRRETAREHLQDVANRRAGRGGNDADASRQRRERLLVCLLEQPFCLELRLQFLESPAQQTLAGGLHVFDDELVAAARLVHRDARPDDDLVTVIGPEPEQPVLAAEHRAADLRPVVLQREVQVPGTGPGEVRELAGDP